MEKEELYKKAEKSLAQAFEVAKQSVKTVSEKAGEAASITKLLIEKASLEHKVTKQFAKLGSRIYQSASENSGNELLQDPEIKAVIEETRGLDKELAKVEAALEQEKKKKK